MNAYQDVSQTPGRYWGNFTGTSASAFEEFRERPRFVRELQQRSSFEYDERHSQRLIESHQSALNGIRRAFVLHDETTVMSFLYDHRIIPQLLLESVPQLQRFFGSQTVFVLKTLCDEDGSRELYVVAMWPGKAGDAMNALDNFNEGWWIARSRPAMGKLNFTYELE